MKQFQHVFIFLLLGLFSCGSDSQKTTDIRDEAEKSSIEATLVDNSLDTSNQTKEKLDDGIVYENTNRVVWQKLNEIIEMMGDLSDKTIADIGAGKGHFAIPLAKKAKKVVAIDIKQEMINHIDSIKILQLPEEFQPRLEGRHTSETNPGLNIEEADIVIIVNTYTFISNRIEWLKKVKNGLKPGGRVYIIDFKMKRIPLIAPNRLPLYTVENEVEEAGFNFQSIDSKLDYQYIVIANKPLGDIQ